MEQVSAHVFGVRGRGEGVQAFNVPRKRHVLIRKNSFGLRPSRRAHGELESRELSAWRPFDQEPGDLEPHETIF